MNNIMVETDVTKVTEIFTKTVQWVAKIVYSTVATVVDLITSPAILSILVSLSIIYMLYRWFRSKTPGM